MFGLSNRFPFRRMYYHRKILRDLLLLVVSFKYKIEILSARPEHQGMETGNTRLNRQTATAVHGGSHLRGPPEQREHSNTNNSFHFTKKEGKVSN